MAVYGYIEHHGIKGQRWGVKNGPPYPLDYEQHNSREKKANSKSSLSRYVNNNSNSGLKATPSTKEKKNVLRSARAYIGNKSGHYLRNQNNTGLPKNDAEAKKMGWKKLSAKESAMHQFNQADGVLNSKWISKDGHKEVVFTGKGKNQRITKDPRDIGTYNFYDPTVNPFKHTISDVLPYIVLGNTEDDPTTAVGRVGESIKSFLKKSPEEVSKETKAKGKELTESIIKENSGKTTKSFFNETREDRKARRQQVRSYKKSARDEYKEIKKQYDAVKKEYDFSRKWATNKAFQDYLNADTKQKKNLAKAKVNAENFLTKEQAIKFGVKTGKKVGKKALSLGKKAATAYVLNKVIPGSGTLAFVKRRK